MASFIVERLQHVAPGLVYLIVALLVFGEAAMFIGFVLPGETAVILGGFIASRGRVNIVALCALVVVAAIVGDSVGYWVGRRWGPKLLTLPVVRHRRAGIHRAMEGLQRRGPVYVFLGRFGAFFRAVMPGLAGLSEMQYGRFLVANAAGGLVWGLSFTLLGYFAGNAYKRIEHYSSFVAVGVAVLVIGLAFTLHLRSRRRERVEEAAYDAAHPEVDDAEPD